MIRTIAKFSSDTGIPVEILRGWADRGYLHTQIIGRHRVVVGAEPVDWSRVRAARCLRQVDDCPQPAYRPSAVEKISAIGLGGV